MTGKRMVFLVALLTLALAGLAAPGEEPASTVDQAPSRFAALDGLRVHYKSLGHGETALVFVHGWTCDLTFWRAQVPAFVDKTRVLLTDLPGHGQSAKPTIEYTMDLFARAVDAVLQDARVDTAVLVGHSMGMPVIRQFYRLFPHKTRALVAVDGSLRAFDDKAGEFAQLIARLSGPDYQDTQAKFIDGMFTEQTPAGVRETVKATMQRAPQHVAVSALKGIVDPAIWKDDAIAVPLQVIVAKTPFWSADHERYVRTLAPQVDYRVMDGVGHFLMLENPGAFNERLAAFLRNERFLEP
jgi:pimeloyl-ACP methyl ester carboxylesterase